MNYTDEQLRKVDLLVAEKVMGYGRKEFGDNTPSFCIHPVYKIACNLPYFTTSISAAWEVVEKFNNRLILVGPTFLIGETGKPSLQESWACEISINEDEFAEVEQIPTAALAICLAALKAKGIDVNKELGIE